MRLLHLLILLPQFLAPSPAGAQVPVDTMAVELRPVPAAVEAFRDDPRFDYDREMREGQNPLSRLWMWFLERFLRPALSALPPQVLNYGMYALLAVVLGFALYQLATTRRQGLTARSERRHLDDELRSRGIEEIDLERWLREADAAGRHRESVRIRYLLILQHLAAEGIIEWRIDKTNRAYVGEMAEHPSSETFAGVTELFERVWYGNRPADLADVDRARSLVGELLSPPEPVTAQ